MSADRHYYTISQYFIVLSRIKNALELVIRKKVYRSLVGSTCIVLTWSCNISFDEKVDVQFFHLHTIVRSEKRKAAKSCTGFLSPLNRKKIFAD